MAGAYKSFHLTLELVPDFRMRKSMSDRTLRSGQLAEATGVSSDTLRYYERKGVLARPRRSANGYRLYPFEAIKRVSLIRRALLLGFTLDELAPVLRVRDEGGAPCKEVRELVARKLSNVESQLIDLVALRDELRKTLQDWDGRLAQRKNGDRVGLLEDHQKRSKEKK